MLVEKFTFIKKWIEIVTVEAVIASSVKMLLLNQLIKQGSGWWTRHLNTYVVRHIGLGWFWYSVAAPFPV